MPRTLPVLSSLLALILAMFLPPCSCATSNGGTGGSERDDELDDIVIERLAFYADAFPEVSFVALSAGEAWANSYRIFLVLLGDHAQNLDYEHPSNLREDLLYVTKARVQAMLRAGESSSSLFRVGIDSAADRKYICAITVNPSSVARDDNLATQHLLGIFREDASHDPVQKSQHLNYRHHLEYVLDHEIFHCLDALYNRPIPMSNDERTTRYYHFLNESGADVFAIAMHFRRHGLVSQYPERLSHIRGLSLFWGDPGHFTYQSIREVLKRKNDDLKTIGVRDIVALAASVRDQAIGGFGEYVAYELAAKDAGDVLQADSETLCRVLRGQPPKDTGIPVTDRLVSISCTCYTAVFGP